VLRKRLSLAEATEAAENEKPLGDVGYLFEKWKAATLNTQDYQRVGHTCASLMRRSLVIKVAPKWRAVEINMISANTTEATMITPPSLFHQKPSSRPCSSAGLL